MRPFFLAFSKILSLHAKNKNVIPFKRLDYLFFSYLLLSTLFLLMEWGDYSPLLLLTRLILVPTILVLIYINQKSNNNIINILRNSYPLILSGYFYSETYFYNQLFMENIDSHLILWEDYIFGSQLSITFSQLLPQQIFSELMYFGYFSFYLLILFFSLYVLFQKKELFNQLVFKLSASLYIFYTIFCIIPSAGPQFYFAFPDNQVPDAYIFKDIVIFIQDTAEHPTGAFPSSHVGISIIILMLSWKYIRVFFHWSWPFVILLILSTVYIKAHYAIDVVGGLLIAPFILYLSDFLYQAPTWKQQESTNHHN